MPRTTAGWVVTGTVGVVGAVDVVVVGEAWTVMLMVESAETPRLSVTR